MSIFGKIASAIFGIHTANAAEAQPGEATMPSNMPAASTPAPTAANPAPKATGAPATATAAAAPVVLTGVDIGEVLDGLADKQDEDLDWKRSIVDLMKLLKLDSGLAARKELAKELGYTGNMGDSASMNVWLHKQVMTKLAQNGGNVPAELRH